MEKRHHYALPLAYNKGQTMNGIKCRKILLFFFAASLPLTLPIALASCTTVSFEVEHPPIVDLRNVNTITVIPFEWSSAGRYEHLSKCVTSALTNGIRMGKINFIDPYALENISKQNYRNYADIYITGRITNASTNTSTETREERYRNNYSHENVTTTITVITITTTVDIEYSYIRSIDNRVLGHFKKRETSSASYEHSRSRNVNRNSNQNTSWNTNRDQRRQGGQPGAYQQRRGVVDIGTAEDAIAKFSNNMDHELGPYTTTEKRNIKGRAGNDRRVIEAKRLIRQDKYDEALAIYRGIYEQDSGVAAGYNTAILLAANTQYADALTLLTNLHKRTEDSGKRSPSFVKKDIMKLTEFINGFKILEAYKKNETVSNIITPVVASEAAPRTPSGTITGTANINEAVVYALNGPISSVNDTSVFTKMVAYTNVNKGQWSMDIPGKVPASLWFLLIVEDRYFYISKTMLSTSTTVVLNTAFMNRLEEQ